MSQTLAAFGASAYLTLFFCAANYLIDGNACTDTSEGRGSDSRNEQKEKPNPVDQLFRSKVVHCLTRSGTLHFKRWSKAINHAVLLYSDQQSFTGIAILASGFSQFPCSLATYHWQLTFDLAWFSSITHLTTLTCLRHYFQERPALRIWRLIWMAITAIMLSVSLVSTGYIRPYETDPSYPAWCLYHQYNSGTADYNSWYIGITFSFLSISYMTRVVQLFPVATKVANHWSKVWPSKRLELCLKWMERRALRSSSKMMRIVWALVYRLLLSIWCVLKATAGLWSSMLWEVVEFSSLLSRRKVANP